MTPFDPKWPKIKFDTGHVFIWSNYIYTEVFMTQVYMSHRKRIFKPKFKIWPQMTPLDLEVTRPNFPGRVMSNKHIDSKKSSKKGHVCPWKFPQNSILQVDLLKILKNSRSRNENFDIFFDPKEPEYIVFGPIQEPSKLPCSISFKPPINKKKSSL